MCASAIGGGQTTALVNEAYLRLIDADQVEWQDRVHFFADDTSLHRKVALKLLPPDLQQDTASHKRFIREAQCAAALDHPFICHINEVGESGGKSFIVMEYVDGQTLKDRLAKGPMPVKEALQLAREIAEALEEAHEKSIVHRDLKPANIMLTRKGHAKLLYSGGLSTSEIIMIDNFR